jgi:hypothetical protein
MDSLLRLCSPIILDSDSHSDAGRSSDQLTPTRATHGSLMLMLLRRSSEARTRLLRSAQRLLRKGQEKDGRGTQSLFFPSP